MSEPTQLDRIEAMLLMLVSAAFNPKQDPDGEKGIAIAIYAVAKTVTEGREKADKGASIPGPTILGWNRANTKDSESTLGDKVK